MKNFTEVLYNGKSLNEQNEQTSFVKMVLWCKDYNIFSEHQGEMNRKIQRKHVESFKVALKKYGFCSVIVAIETKAITGKKELFIADGQHRLKAIEELGMAFSYMVIRLKKDTYKNVTKFIASLNNNSKHWTISDYFERWTQGKNSNNEYVILQNWMEKAKSMGVKITNNDLWHIVFSKCNKDVVNAFKSGEMKFENLKESEALFNLLMRIGKIIPAKYHPRRGMYHFFIQEKINSKLYPKFIDAIEKHKKNGIEFSWDELAFKEQIREIWAKTCNKKYTARYVRQDAPLKVLQKVHK